MAAREATFALRMDSARAIVIAARDRDATSDALDAAADQREKDLDMARMLSTVSDKQYGSDWPARRDAVLHREHAKADRASARADLAALVADSSDFRSQNP